MKIVQRSMLTTVLVFTLLSPLASAQEQTRTLRVLVENSILPQGKRLLDGIESRLADMQRPIKFQVLPISGEIREALASQTWDMGIVATTSLVHRPGPSTVAVFDMPFVFDSASRAIELQHGTLGRAALANLATHGMTGLVYLNNGTSLIASNKPVQSLADFKGRKVVAYSTAEAKTLQALGGSPVRVRFAEVYNVLQAGAADSAVVRSTTTATSIFEVQKYLLNAGLTAQVAVLVAQEKNWAAIPFQYRARIGDAAIAVSERLNSEVIETEKSFFVKARAAGTTVVNFRKDEALRATRTWIDAQPSEYRSSYSTALEEISRQFQPPAAPSPNEKGSQESAVYFATTREDTNDASLLYRFGDARTPLIKCGKLAFPPGSDDASAAHFVGPVISDNAACASSTKDILKSAQHLLLFIHGFNNRFSDAAERGALLKRAFGPDTEVLIWSWPAKREALGLNYDYDKESATGVQSRELLRRFLKDIQPNDSAKQIDVLAHSMGNVLLLGTLTQLANDGTARSLLGTVTFAAPDVAKDDFIYSLGEIAGFGTKMTLYACDADWALALSTGVNQFPRAGTGGATNIIVLDGNTLESVDVDGRLLSLNHAYVFESPAVLTDLVTFVRDRRDPAARGLRQHPKSPRYYWSL